MKMQERLNQLISELAAVLPEGVISHLRSMVSAGEFGVALEELCAYIGEADHKVVPEHRQLIEQLGNELAVDPSWWKALPQT
jgi:hypothetical protein